MKVVAFAVALLATVLTASANAATITRDASGIRYQGDALADEFTVSEGPGQTIVFTRDPDGQAALTAGPGCTQVEADEQVSCPGFTNVKVDTLGGDDSIKGFATTGFFCTVAVTAGDGADLVEGANNGCPDMIDGGAGPDAISSFGGDDVINGGSDEDTIDPGAGADDVDGGDGSDSVLYPREAGHDVTVTLDDVENDGEAGEGDNIRVTVEHVVGGAGNDRLTGSASSNRLIGGAGADELTGGSGADDLGGGAGNDVIDAGDSEPDTVDCGEGTDTATIDGTDSPVTACESVTNVDADGDFSHVGEDCNDADPNIRPGAADVPENGVDEDCDGRDAGDFDRDRDGVTRPLDCDDDNPGVNPGVPEVPGNAVDENCDRVVAPFPRITSGVVNRWRAFTRFTQVIKLTVRDAPVGAVAEVRCRGRGCPRRPKRLRSTGGKELRFAGHFGKRRLRVGARIEIRITLGGMIGKYVRYRMRPKRKPSVIVRCLDPGSRKPTRCPVGS